MQKSIIINQAGIKEVNVGYIQRTIDNPIKCNGMGICLASSANRQVGFGNIIQIPFNQLRQIDYNRDGILITYGDTPQSKYLEAFDVAFLGDLEHWATKEGYKLEYKN